MKKLIEALQIFAKYQDLTFPTHYERDEVGFMIKNVQHRFKLAWQHLKN